MSERTSTTARLLEVSDLHLSFPTPSGGSVRILDGVSFDVGHKETVGLVGESGSGKTLTALTVMGLQDHRASIEGGRILLDGTELLGLGEDQKRAFRGKRIAMIFQSPKSGLNPLTKVGKQITRVVRLHQDVSKEEAHGRAVELMRSVGINDALARFHAYPHQLSGGMAQRVMIAMALAADPEILIADEPTTALDVTIQDQIFRLLLELQERIAMSILLITHDLALVAETCDRIAVMHGGRVVELGTVTDIFDRPKHPYTRRLLRSVLRADRRVEMQVAFTGHARTVFDRTACRYAGRCEHEFGPCTQVRPRLTAGLEAPGHAVLCHLYDPRFCEQTEEGRRSERAAPSA
jgi:oligopeptide/dipeptide ABC transporter ATP-binding protein